MVEHCENRHVALGTIPSSTHNTHTKRKWGTGGGVQRFRTLALPEVGCSHFVALLWLLWIPVHMVYIHKIKRSDFSGWCTPVISALKKAEATGLSQGQHSLPHKFQASQHKKDSIYWRPQKTKDCFLHRDQLV